MTTIENPLYPKDGEGDHAKHGGGANSVRNARCLRREMSLPERLLWQRLRGRTGLKVRRQHPIGRYIAGFYTATAKLVVEIDGRAHDERVDRDARRDAFLSGLGLRVLRLPAADVLRDIDAATDSISRAAMPLHRSAGGPAPHATHGEELASVV